MTQGSLDGRSEDTSVETLPSLDISATRSKKRARDIPAAVNRVNRHEIQQGRPTVTLDESLLPIPGVFSQNQYNFAQDLRLSIRGFGARSPFGVRGVKVLVDGIPQTQADGITQLDSIDSAVIESIEIMRGPSSSLYGNASGGVVLIHTEDGADSPFEIVPRFVVGEFGLQKYQVKIGGSLDTVNYRLFASHLMLDGFRDNSHTENTLVQGKVRFQSGLSSDWTLTFGHFNSPLAEDPGALTRAQAKSNPEQARAGNLSFSAGERVTEENIGLIYRKETSSNHEFTATAFFTRRDFANRLPFTTGGIVEFERLAPGLGVKSIWDSKFFGMQNRLIAGVDAQYQHDDRKRFNNNLGTKGNKTLDQIESVTSLGPYLRGELQVSSRLDLVGGARYDRVHFDLEDTFLSDGDQTGSRTLSEWSGTVGAVFHIDDTRHLYANVATVFEAPTTTELIVNPSGGPGFNSNLESQKSISYEIGIKGQEGRWMDYEAAFFFIHSEDELVPFELAGSPGRTFFRNAGESERKGVEVQIKFRPVDRVQTSVAYTFLDSEFTEFVSGGVDLSGNSIPGIPKHRLAGNVSIQSERGWFSRLELQFVDEFYVDNANTTQNFSYITSQLTLGKEGEAGPVRWTAFLGLNNILDRQYNGNTRINAAGSRFFEPAPPFNVFAGISLGHAAKN